MTLAEQEMDARREFIVRSETSMREVLRAMTWEEKIDSIERMREFDRVAKESMRKTTLEESGNK